MPETIGPAIVAAGQAVGIGAGSWGGFRLLQWCATFLCGRLDKKQDQLDEKEARIDAGLAKRLAWLEAQELMNRDRIQVLEAVTTTLLAELRSIDPANEKLHDVANILRASIPFPGTPSPSIEQTMNQLRGIK
jgi:hypothetical protein